MWPIITTVFSFLGGAIGPVANALTKLKELKLRAEELLVQKQTSERDAELQETIRQINAYTQIVLADTKGESWYQKAWRPFLAVLFTLHIIVTPYINAMIVPYYFWMQPVDLAPEITGYMMALLGLGWTLREIFKRR